MSAREAHPLHDLTIARQELAFQLLQKASNGRKRSRWYGALSQADRSLVDEAIQEAPRESPTFVVDKTLLKNMTPAERALARRQQR